MALSTHPERVRTHDTEASGPNTVGGSIRAAGHAVRRLADAVSESCRRIRAYNDLANLRPQALQDIGRRHDELDRVIGGEVPHSGRRNQAPVR